MNARPIRAKQAHNQLGTPGVAKSFLRGARIFETLSNIFKLCPTHFCRGVKTILRAPPLVRSYRAKSLPRSPDTLSASVRSLYLLRQVAKLASGLLYCVTIPRQQNLKCSLQIMVVSVLPHVTRAPTEGFFHPDLIF